MTQKILAPGSFDHFVHVLIDTYQAHLASGSSEASAMHAALVAAFAAYQDAEKPPEKDGKDTPFGAKNA